MPPPLIAVLLLITNLSVNTSFVSFAYTPAPTRLAVLFMILIVAFNTMRASFNNVRPAP